MINFDQASSSFPKAPTVPDAVAEFIRTGASNISRGSLNISYEASQLVFKCREFLLEYFGAKDKHVIFTKNVTESLNLLLKGFLKSGDHIVISSLEHNAVMRPIKALEAQGVEYSAIPCDDKGRLSLELVDALITPKTKAILVTSANNVIGTILPLRALGRIAKAHGIPFFVDGAQLAGFLPIHMERFGIDALAITGHKSLLGPQGIGALILSDELGKSIEPLVHGGTGSVSDRFDMPETLPDRFEAGTMNLVGVAGLMASMRWLSDHHEEVILHEMELTSHFIAGIKRLSAQYPIRLVGLNGAESGYDLDAESLRACLAAEAPKKASALPESHEWLVEKIKRVPVVSIYSDEIDVAVLSYYLESEGKIATRVGMHCSPLSHQSIGTFPKGTLRFSFGYHETVEDVDACLALIEEFLQDAHEEMEDEE